jgi:hypothetical protein
MSDFSELEQTFFTVGERLAELGASLVELDDFQPARWWQRLFLRPRKRAWTTELVWHSAVELGDYASYELVFDDECLSDVAA